MEYTPSNSGLLNASMVKDGDRLILVEDAYSTFSEPKQKTFWNVKVQLPNGEHKLAGIMDMVGDEFVKAWGGDTKMWTGHVVIVEIRTAKSSGNQYIVMKPSDEPVIKIEGQVASPEQVSKEHIAKTGGSVAYPTEQINPDDIPF